MAPQTKLIGENIMKEIDKLIIERARISPLAFAVQTEMDKENFVAFVKAFALDAIHDLSISQKLFETGD